jgi:beta-phosphoglucomutase
VFEDSVAGVQAVLEYDQHRNWEASTLHEAKYIFKDFTAIDTHS